MNILLSCIGKRGYIADYFRQALPAGSRIVGTSNTEWAPGLQACDASVILPPIASDEYVPAVLEACAHHDIAGALSMFDPDVYRLAPHRDDFLTRGIVPVFPGTRAATVAFDKLETFRFLSDIGVRVPMTTDSLEEAAQWLASGDLAFPVIVKPRCGFGSANTFVARNEAELRVFFGYVPDMLVQQFVEAEALNVDGLGDMDARPVGAVPWRKLLSKLGETERAETIECPELVELAGHLVREVGIVGPFDADFFRDDSGQLWVLELNTRFGGGYPVSHLAGADFPAVVVRLIRGEGVPPCVDYKRGVTMMKQLQPISGPDTPV